METKKTLNIKKWSWRNQGPWLQTILQTYSKQDGMVLLKKKKKDSNPRDKPTYIYGAPNLLLEIMQKYTMEKRQSLQ